MNHSKKLGPLATLSVISAAFATTASAALTVYDGTEANTLHLWQFNEANNTFASTAATVDGRVLILPPVPIGKPFHILSIVSPQSPIPNSNA